MQELKTGRESPDDERCRASGAGLAMRLADGHPECSPSLPCPCGQNGTESWDLCCYGPRAETLASQHAFSVKKAQKQNKTKQNKTKQNAIGGAPHFFDRNNSGKLPQVRSRHFGVLGVHGRQQSASNIEAGVG